jgi:predicted outer membrane protein
MNTHRVAATLVVGAAALAVPAHAAAPGVSAQDENYLQTAAAGDSFEIKGGQLALQKSQNAQVQALARTLIRDHTESLRDAKRIARQLGIPKVQNRPTPTQSWELRQLQAKAGVDFDRQYTDLEVADHHEDIGQTKFEAKKGSAQRVVADAKKELPTLAKHLKLARAARDAIGR